MLVSDSCRTPWHWEKKSVLLSWILPAPSLSRWMVLMMFFLPFCFEIAGKYSMILCKSNLAVCEGVVTSKEQLLHSAVEQNTFPRLLLTHFPILLLELNLSHFLKMHVFCPWFQMSWKMSHTLNYFNRVVWSWVSANSIISWRLLSTPQAFSCWRT